MLLVVAVVVGVGSKGDIDIFEYLDRLTGLIQIFYSEQ